jgi:hypothetical protein
MILRAHLRRCSQINACLTLPVQKAEATIAFFKKTAWADSSSPFFLLNRFCLAAAIFTAAVREKLFGLTFVKSKLKHTQVLLKRNELANRR